MKVSGIETFDPVFDSQRVFRCLLQAASNPGKLFALPWEISVEAVAQTLLDHEVSFCAVGAQMSGMQERVSAATGASVVPLPEADFALISGEGARGEVLNLKRGTLEQPERGATVIYAVERLLTDGPLTIRLSGPGVPGERTLGVEGLSASEVEAIRESRTGYPLGVDVYLLDEAGRVAGLPRSTRIELVR